MNHSFNIEVAIDYGVHEAILLENIFFWVEKNKANGQSFHDGYYWTYNSSKAFSELFPYFTERQIGYALKKLENNDLILTANYNKLKYDRTKWYSVTEKARKYYKHAISQNCQMEPSKLPNGTVKIVEPIPDINTNMKTYIIPLKSGSYELSNEKLKEYKKTYPHIDVEQEITKLIQWNKDNPSKRKPKRGVHKHINYWLSNSQTENTIQQAPETEKYIEMLRSR